MLKTLGYILAAYAAFTTLLFFAQRKLLYLPATHGPSSQWVADRGLTAWPSRDDYRGLLGSGRSAAFRGTVVVFHGNAGGAIDRYYFTDALQPLGFRVILAEYLGYSGRTGKPSEDTLVQDAAQTVRLAYEDFGDPVYLWGESLGSGVAAAVAADASVPVTALVLLTPWNSLPALAQTIYWYLPAKWLVLDRFDSVANLRDFKGRIAVAIAERDEVIPPALARSLYQSIDSEKKLWVFPAAGHNSWPIQPAERWWQEVMDFVSVRLPPSAE